MDRRFYVLRKRLHLWSYFFLVVAVLAITILILKPTRRDSATDIQAFAAVVQAIIAIALAWMTYVNVKATRQIAEANKSMTTATEEMVREARLTSEMTARATSATEDLARATQFHRLNATVPVIDIVLHKLTRRSDETTCSFNVEVVNVGLGPAVYVNTRWTRPRAAPGEELPHRCEHTPFPEQATLAAGQKITLTFTIVWIGPAGRLSGDEAAFGDYVLGELSVWYFDIYERRGEIRRTIGLSQRRLSTQVQFFVDEDTRFEVPGLEPWRYRSHLDE